MTAPVRDFYVYISDRLPDPPDFDRMVEALYLLRLPHSLRSTIPILHRFFELAEDDRYPELCVCDAPDINTTTWITPEEFTARIEVLEKISALPVDESSEFACHNTSNDRTPLSPLTGDSSIGDILLIRHDSRMYEELYDRVIAWFVWQGIKHHLAGTEYSDYRKYLLADEHPTRLKDSLFGSRLYNAFLGIRELADFERRDDLEGFNSLDLRLTPEASIDCFLPLKLAQSQANKRRLASIRLFAQIERKIKPVELESYAHAAAGIRASITRILTDLWAKRFDTSLGGGHGNPNSKHRKVFTPSVRAYKGRINENAILDNEGIGGASVLEVWDTESEIPNDLNDDPDGDTGGDADLSVYLSTNDDLIQACYAAKGLQHAIERNHALLPWSADRLSNTAIEAVLSLLQMKKEEEELVSFARLAIGICLFSGRDIRQASDLRVGENGRKVNGKLIIDVEKGQLIVPAGRPELKHPPDQLNVYHPHDHWLTLSLPSPILKLAEYLQDKTYHRAADVERYARSLIAELPDHFQVSLSSLRQVMVSRLLALSKGDLGLVKVVTDRTNVNFSNIIHYYSVNRAKAETLWLTAVRGIIQDAPQQLEILPTHHRVGCPQAFDCDGLAEYFREIRRRFDEACEQQDWIRAFNLITLQTVLHLNLATAGRASTTPGGLVYFSNGWMLVGDKRREDGSSDRLAPSTRALRQQIRAFVAFARYMALRFPDLQPLDINDDGVALRFHFLKRAGQVIDFQPLMLKEIEGLVPLPGNWARKLCRSEADKLPGRIIDALLGHWVKGRHPWRFTSNMSPRHLAAWWLKYERRLERELGISAFQIPGFEGQHAGEIPALYVSHSRISSNARKIDWLNEALNPPKKKRKPRKEYAWEADSEEDILRRVSESGYDALMVENPDHALGKDMVERALQRLAANDVPAQVQLAERLCAHLREKHSIPIFATKPRPQFSKDWLIHAASLANLAQYEREFLPRFHADLQNLPNRGEGQEGDLVELGRLCAVLIWRLGLLSWPQLDSALDLLRARQPILATGDLRYLNITTVCRRTGELSQRMCFLDDFCQQYLPVELKNLQRIIDKVWIDKRQRRRKMVNTALRAYLKSIEVSLTPNLLTDMLQAAQQYIMLHGSPLLAAYASGEFYTVDMGDDCLRRLAGYTPRAGYIVPDSSLTNIRADSGQDRDVVTIPKDLKAANNNFVHALIAHRAVNAGVYRDKVAKTPVKTPLQGFVKAYFLWLLDKEIAKSGKAQKTKALLQGILSHFEVVAYALMGLVTTDQSFKKIEEELLDTLMELSEDMTDGQYDAQAWFWFKAYLRDQDADKAGIEVGEISTNKQLGVSNYILGTTEVDAVRERLKWKRSGIGVREVRTAAQHHLDLLSTYGVRRSEAEKLRTRDWQGDIIRVQPYGDHSLKTVCSNRVLPIAFAAEGMQAWMRTAAESGFKQLIDAKPNDPISGHRFYYKVNKLIQSETQCEYLHLHHCRHTLASQLLLSVCEESVDYWRITDDFPWLKDALISHERLDILLGGEGSGVGHGVQAISALMGHAHPTTTLRHYIHTCGIAFYALQNKLNRLDLPQSFKSRLPVATVEQWVRQSRKKTGDAPAKMSTHAFNRSMRDLVERRFKQAIHFDEARLEKVELVEDITIEPEDGMPAISIEHFDSLDMVLRNTLFDELGPDYKRIASALVDIGEIKSGKRGSALPRHKLDYSGENPVPVDTKAGSPIVVAQILCEWLTELRANRTEDYQWLITKWIYQTEAQRGWITLDNQAEVERIQSLPQTKEVLIEIKRAAVSKTRSSGTAKQTMRARFRFRDERWKPIQKNVAAVKWVMLWSGAHGYLNRHGFSRHS